MPEEAYDSRSLYERLKEQKDKRDLDFEEAHKLSTFSHTLPTFSINLLIFLCGVENLIRGLDDDEADFLEIVDKAKLNAEKKQQIEERTELHEFRERVRLMQENVIDQKISSEIVKRKPKPISAGTNRSSQKSILSGIIRKRKSEEPSRNATSQENDQQVTKSGSGMGTPNGGNGQPIKAAESSGDGRPREKRANIRPTHGSLDEGSLKCIGILPGIGCYKESSDSDKSTDTDDEYDFSDFDWVGRKIKKESNESECH